MSQSVGHSRALTARGWLDSALAGLVLVLAISLCTGAAGAQTLHPDAGTHGAGAPSQGPAPLAEPSASARELFARNKERLLQVRVLLASANEQSSLGSGFLVPDGSADGVWVVTNYHVISALAIDPHKYRLELRDANQRSVRAQLVALDVIHDLAVLRIEPEATAPAPPWKTFALRPTALAQGSKVFALGNPLELGFLISDGIYNGLVESRIYEQMLFSGAINSGMSGGPAIDEAGQVVGINVATRRDGQSLSFLVPVQYLRALLQQAAKGKARSEWRSEIARQLLQHQDFVTSKLLAADHAPGTAPAPHAGFASQTLAGRTVATLDGSLTKCWARGAEGEKLRLRSDSLNCSLRAELFVGQQLNTGSLAMLHVLLRNEKLATPQFLSMGSGTSLDRGSPRSETTRNECHGDFVQGARHVYRVSVCVRAYRKFAGLYELSLSAVQIDDPRERLASAITLRGFSLPNAQRLSTHFLGLLQ